MDGNDLAPELAWGGILIVVVCNVAFFIYITIKHRDLHAGMMLLCFNFCLFILVGIIAIGVVNGTDDSAPIRASDEMPQPQVASWLRQNLKDPDSLEIIETSPVRKTVDGYSVDCRYRAKNSFGGYEVEDRTFTLDSAGDVIDASDNQ